MRDVGILIWVALLIVGVVGSMVRQIRARAPARPNRVPEPVRPPPPPPWAQQMTITVAPPAAQPRVPKPPPRPAPAPVERVSQHEVGHSSGPEQRRRPLFGGKNEIVRAVIASEVLGKPRAFDDEYFGR
jgi:hypothetical protein